MVPLKMELKSKKLNMKYFISSPEDVVGLQLKYNKACNTNSLRVEALSITVL